MIEPITAVAKGADGSLKTAYSLQKELFANDVVDPQRMAIAATWLSEDQNHPSELRREGYDVGELFGLTNSTALTVCDGRFGLDSVRLRKMGAPHVTPSDISPYLLEKAKEEGQIAEYHVENAEFLSFADGAYDFVFCREGFHHVPRAWVAFYEMMRVARRAVVLQEPQAQDRTFYAWLRQRRGPPRVTRGEYEIGGNFVYRLSLDELLRACFGLDLPYLAVRRRNAAYVKGMEFVKRGSPSHVRLVYQAKLAARRLASGLGLINTTVLGAIAFKVQPTDQERAWLAQNGWRLLALQRNPHL